MNEISTYFVQHGFGENTVRVVTDIHRRIDSGVFSIIFIGGGGWGRFEHQNFGEILKTYYRIFFGTNMGIT